MVAKTVTWVADDLSTWENNGKTTWYVNVAFSDETVGSVGKQNEAKAQELHGLLVGLIGKEAEFGLKDTGKTSNKGQPKFKIESFPGYEPAPYDGPGGGGKASWYNSQEGVHFTQERTDRRAALMQAVALLTAGVVSPDLVIAEDKLSAESPVVAVTEHLYKLLRATASTVPGQSSSANGGVAAPTAPSPNPVRQYESGGMSDFSNVPQATKDPGETTWGAPAGEGAGTGESREAAPGACSHQGSPLKLDGTELPGGRLRCVHCGLVSDTKGVFK